MRRGTRSRWTIGILAVLVAATGATSTQAAFPGGNGKILFEREKKLFTISPNGPVNSDKLLGRVGTTTSGLEYSPNGRKIAFSADLGAGQSFQIILVNAKGERAMNVTHRADKCLGATSPSFSPNGKKIAFICNDKGFPSSFEVYTINIDGTGLKRITDTNEVDYLKWNPADPGEIAFVSGQILYTVPSAGGNPQVLNDDPPGITGAGWFSFDYSPDGERLVVESGEGNLHMMNSTTGSYGPSLVGGDDSQIEPAFSPDGGSITFINASSSGFDVATAPASGAATAKLLTATGSSERSPTWRPIP